MKLMLEGWNKFLKENEQVELDEGLMSALSDPELAKNVGIVITAFVEMAKVFGPAAAAGMIIGYATNKTKDPGSKGPTPDEMPPGPRSTSKGDTEEMLKGMEWPKKRETKK